MYSPTSGCEYPRSAATAYSCEAAARAWFKASKRSRSSASVNVTGQPYATNTAASSFRCVSTSQLELGWRKAGVWDSSCRLCARIPYNAPMGSGGWHPRRSCPTGYSGGSLAGKGHEWYDTPPLAELLLRYRKYLRSNQVSLPEPRKLSDPHSIAKPLTGFAHLRTEKKNEKIEGKEWRKRWTDWPAIPRSCSAMALPWPTGTVGRKAGIQPRRAESSL